MKNLKKFLVVLLLLVLVFIISGCNKKKDSNTFVYNDIEFTIYSIMNDKQKEAYDAGYNKANVYAKGSKELSKPNPIHLEFDKELSYIKLSLDKSFIDFIKVEVKDKSVDLVNLYINKPYYYQGFGSDDKELTDIKGLIIENIAPRTLDIDGLTNSRDLGGWMIGSDKQVKQGLLYRTSKLTADETGEVLITSKGIEVYKNELLIKTELDLRLDTDGEQGGITESVVNGVTYISYPMVSGGNLLILDKDLFKDLFVILSNEDNYPLNFHCSIGTDRTGVVAFLINGLLGVSKEDLYRDYLFSNFGVIGKPRTSATIDDYLLELKKYEGSTLSEQIENYLINVGVSQDNIDNLKRILIEDAFIIPNA